VFQSVFPDQGLQRNPVLEFVKYELEKPKYDVEECQQRDMTYSAPLKVTLRLIVFDVDEDTGAKSVKDIKEQDVFMGDMPLMTPNGTFVVNGTERVIVSQMHRLPACSLITTKAKHIARVSLLFACRIIPIVARGSTLNSTPKISSLRASTVVVSCLSRRLLYALGLDQEGIMDAYYEHVDYKLKKKRLGHQVLPRARARHTSTYDLVDAKRAK